MIAHDRDWSKMLQYDEEQAMRKKPKSGSKDLTND